MRIPFEALNNTRDLGGMKGWEGKTIRPGMLFRSGSLNPATEADMEKLTSLGITTVIDLRSHQETAEAPDPVIPGMEIILLPLSLEAQTGVSADTRSRAELIDAAMAALRTDPMMVRRQMRSQYRNYVELAVCREKFRKFFDILLTAPGPVLWHCAGGKDRTGVAALLLETVLGVDEKVIRIDYMATNDNKREEVAGAIGELLAQGFPEEVARPMIEDTYYARDEYLDSYLSNIRCRFGSMEEYLRSGIGITQDRIDRLRERYLKG